jgi:hypothetical protein
MHLPLLSFDELQTSYSESTGVLNVTVFYSLPDGTESMAQVGTVQISGNQPPKEL